MCVQKSGNQRVTTSGIANEEQHCIYVIICSVQSFEVELLILKTNQRTNKSNHPSLRSVRPAIRLLPSVGTYPI